MRLTPAQKEFYANTMADYARSRGEEGDHLRRAYLAIYEFNERIEDLETEVLRLMELQPVSQRNFDHLWTQWTEDRTRQWDRINADDAREYRHWNHLTEYRDKTNRKIGWLAGTLIIFGILILVLLVAAAS